jgi:hypothetical protein
MTSTRSVDSPWAFPGERRQHERTSVDLRVRLHGPRGEILVRALNVSATGALLELSEQDLCTVPPLIERSVLHGVARTLFSAHLDVTFLERGVAVGARLARMVCPPDATERLQLGIRFLEPLTSIQGKRLGVNANAVPADEARPAGRAAMAADPLTRVVATVRGLDDPSEEALATGPLLGIADHAVAFRDRAGDAGETVARLAGRPLTLQVHEGTDVLWRTTAHLISVRSLETWPGSGVLSGGVEATVLTDADPAAAVASRLRTDADPVAASA